MYLAVTCYHPCMAGRPKHTKPDGNQEEIVKELKRLGFDVDDVHNQPGLYDLVVSGERYVPSHRNPHYTIECSVRVEVKDPVTLGDLSEKQIQYMMDQNHRNSYIVAYCAKDVLRWFDGIAPK